MRITDMSRHTRMRIKSMRKEEKQKFDEFVENIVREIQTDETKGVNCNPKQAAEIADLILQKAYDMKYYNESATPIVKIIREFGIDICRAKRIPEGISGVIYAGGRTKKVYGSDKIIFTDDSEPFEHQRFVMAHELAHYLFDYLGNPERQNARITFAETYPRKNHNSVNEIRANRFAAELLMPKKLFIKQYNSAMDESNSRFYTIKYLARYFQVKESSIEKRIYEVLYDGG